RSRHSSQVHSQDTQNLVRRDPALHVLEEVESEKASLNDKGMWDSCSGMDCRRCQSHCAAQKDDEKVLFFSRGIQALDVEEAEILGPELESHALQKTSFHSGEALKSEVWRLPT
ncbi:hypothetical protein STEG23_014982, partial [Scotinomys teguina]